MLFLADSNGKYDEIREESGCDVGQLITPLTRYKNHGLTFAIDNGAFKNFDAKAFRSLLERELTNRDKCLFVASPDIVGNARRTLELFNHWYPELSRWPIALVAQDGIENFDLPWASVRAVFIGGSTEFKLSNCAVDLIKTAKAMEKWVHVGRVNTPARYEFFDELGVDSFDGTGLSRYTHMREALKSPNLFKNLGPLGDNHR